MAIDELSQVLLLQQLAEALACWKHTVAIDRKLGPFTDKHSKLYFRTGYNPSTLPRGGYMYSEMHKAKLNDCVALITPEIAYDLYQMLTRCGHTIDVNDHGLPDHYVDSVDKDSFLACDILAYLKTRPSEEFDGVSPEELPGPSFTIPVKPARKRRAPKKETVYCPRKDGARMRIGTRERRGRI